MGALTYSFPNLEPVNPCRRHGFDPWVWKMPLEKEMATQSSILPENSMDRRVYSQHTQTHTLTKYEETVWNFNNGRLNSTTLSLY